MTGATDVLQVGMARWVTRLSQSKVLCGICPGGEDIDDPLMGCALTGDVGRPVFYDGRRRSRLGSTGSACRCGYGSGPKPAFLAHRCPNGQIVIVDGGAITKGV